MAVKIHKGEYMVICWFLGIDGARERRTLLRARGEWRGKESSINEVCMCDVRFTLCSFKCISVGNMDIYTYPRAQGFVSNTPKPTGGDAETNFLHGDEL